MSAIGQLYAKMVQKGTKNIEDVPSAYQDEVKEILGIVEEEVVEEPAEEEVVEEVVEEPAVEEEVVEEVVEEYPESLNYI